MKKRTVKIISAILLAAMLLPLSSCAVRRQENEDEPAAANSLTDGYRRKIPVSDVVPDEFSRAAADFGVRILQNTVTKDAENELVSPVSVLLALSLLANGMEGNTKAQFEEMIGMPVDDLNPALSAFCNRVKDVHFANSIWFNTQMLNENDLKPAFLQKNADYFGADVFGEPFIDETLEKINNWCSEKTDGMIPKILENFGANEAMYLINALFLDAKWANPYPSHAVFDDKFHNGDGTDSDVQFLRGSERRYLDGGNCTGFCKSYEGNLDFVALLPDENVSVYDLIASLDGEKFLNIYNAASYDREVLTRMPKFKYDFGTDLKETLVKMGLSDAFDPGKADLSGIDGNKDLYCGKVIHKTAIELNEAGTRAAAVTAIEVEAKSVGPVETVTVTLDRPFVYAIVDRSTGVPLFLGAITNL